MIATPVSHRLGLCAFAALLTACGGSHSANAVVPGTSSLPDAASGGRTFHYTGAKQSFKVPRGVRTITVVARGASGGGVAGGKGGRVYAMLSVTPGEKLFVFVGGTGVKNLGGFNGGADGGTGYGDLCCRSSFGSGGGGASDVRVVGRRPFDRILVAAGGGGMGGDGNAFGGAGGGANGRAGGGAASGGGGGGSGGSQTEGGAGGPAGPGIIRRENGEPGKDGTLASGGHGGAASKYGLGGGGGGGGGGYYGGGGGGGAGTWPSGQGLGGGGAGGGSSYIEPSAIESHTWAGWKNAEGNGLVVISWK